MEHPTSPSKAAGMEAAKSVYNALRSASRNVHRHAQKDVQGDTLYSGPHGCRIAQGVFRSAEARRDHHRSPSRLHEVDRCERGNHAGGTWHPRRQKREVCSAPVVVRHLEDRIVKESEVSTSRCQDESPKYPYVDASVVSIYRCKYLHIDTSIHM